MQTSSNQIPISVFSESLNERDYLRTHILSCGFNAICFEKENTCIDNFRSIQPNIVIVQTDSAHTVWRFLFALHCLNMKCPLLILSDHLNAERFAMFGLDNAIYSITGNRQGDHLLKKITDLADNKHDKADRSPLPLLVGETDEICKIRAKMPNIANSRDSVLIIGEPGTGKDLLSRFIVSLGRPENVFIKIDCSILSPQGLLKEQFEDIKSLEKDEKLITIFIDKIHMMSKQVQADLLSLLEETQKFSESENPNIDQKVRFIASSESNIEERVTNGTFRKDLFYRLNVIPLFIPPLRNRKKDISLLMDYFLVDACVQNDKCVVIPSEKARELMFLYDWPGNDRELQDYMRRISVAGSESFIFSHNCLPKVKGNSREYLFKSASLNELPKSHEIKSFIPNAKSLSLKGICDEFVSRTERRLMKKALECTNWNRKKAAELLDISYKTLLNKMKAYDIINDYSRY